MPISEKIQKASFSKSMAGYTAREVDAFLGDLLPLALEEEQLVSALRAKLGAMEARTEEIAQQEKEAYRLLERAREEAERIVAAAEEKARTVRTEAEQSAEVRLQNAEKKAAELVAAAERTARASIDTAKKTADTILDTADRKGKALLAEAAAFSNAEREKAQRLTAECTAFEGKFRTLVSETAHALAKLQATAPTVPAPTPKPVTEKPAAPRAEAVPAPAEAAPAPAPAPATPEEPTTRDFTFAGGKPVGVGTEDKPRRKLYDRVTVTYDSDEDFDGIRKLMEESKKPTVKNPTHFSE